MVHRKFPAIGQVLRGRRPLTVGMPARPAPSSPLSAPRATPPRPPPRARSPSCCSVLAADRRAPASAAVTTAGTEASSAATTAEVVDGEVALFDDSVVHDIDVTFDQAAYDTMIADLRRLRRQGVDRGDRHHRRHDLRAGRAPSEGKLIPDGPARGPASGGAGGPGGNVSADTPESLPWLVRLDKFVDGQSYQGYTVFVVRSNNSATALNEAVALELLGLTGQATEEAFATRFSVNGGDEVLRLTIENPDESGTRPTSTARDCSTRPRAGGDYSYRGEDPEAYDEIFDQETGEEDLAPLHRAAPVPQRVGRRHLRGRAARAPRRGRFRRLPRLPGAGEQLR